VFVFLHRRICSHRTRRTCSLRTRSSLRTWRPWPVRTRRTCPSDEENGWKGRCPFGVWTRL